MTQPAIRKLLRKEKGMTTQDIAAALKVSRQGVHSSLQSMPDAYIAAWQPSLSGRGRPAAVWCVVVPPENAKPPGKKR